MPVLHIGDIEIVAHAQQLTSPALHIKNSDEEIYHVAVMPVGGGVFDASETLVYEENTINTCQSFELPAGIYRVEMRGGTGGKPYRCSSGTGTKNALGDITSNIFKLNTATTLYALRGGDGNAGGVNLNSSGYYTGAFGGGASGVDSILVVNDKVWRANGGVGNICAITSKNTVTGTTDVDFGTGGGGNNFTQTQTSKAVFYGSSDAIFVNGGGGGGAPNIPANKEIAINSGSHSDIVERNIGQDGSTDSGEDGGNVTSCTTFDCSELVTATGGKGGKNISYNCGGETVTAYGGGAIRSYTTYNIKIDGGDGGSGSTGTSNVSFLRIYKM